MHHSESFFYYFHFKSVLGYFFKKILEFIHKKTEGNAYQISMRMKNNSEKNKGFTSFFLNETKIRDRTSHDFELQTISKTNETNDLVGSSQEIFKNWMQFQFSKQKKNESGSFLTEMTNVTFGIIFIIDTSSTKYLKSIKTSAWNFKF